MYCDCKTKHKVKSEVSGKSFDVCSKNLGGCGKEIKNNTYNFVDMKVTVNGIDINSISATTWASVSIRTDLDGEGECLECAGAGFIANLYPNGHTEVRCENCDGSGTVGI